MIAFTVMAFRGLIAVLAVMAFMAFVASMAFMQTIIMSCKQSSCKYGAMDSDHHANNHHANFLNNHSIAMTLIGCIVFMPDVNM